MLAYSRTSREYSHHKFARSLSRLDRVLALPHRLAYDDALRYKLRAFLHLRNALHSFDAQRAYRLASFRSLRLQMRLFMDSIRRLIAANLLSRISTLHLFLDSGMQTTSK